MKKLISTIFTVLCFSINAQVGINIENPERSLDINGNLTLRSTEYKNDENYKYVISTNSKGEIEYWTKENILTKMSDGILENKLLYFGIAPTGNIVVPCGRFEIKFAPKINNSNPSTTENDNISDPIPQIRLRKAQATDTKIFFTRIRKIYGNNNTFANSNRTLRTNSTLQFSSANEWESIGIVTDLTDGNAGKGYRINTLDEYFISYPGLPNLYRVSFLARTMTQPNSPVTNSYTMICEKF